MQLDLCSVRAKNMPFSVKYVGYERPSIAKAEETPASIFYTVDHDKQGTVGWARIGAFHAECVPKQSRDYLMVSGIGPRQGVAFLDYAFPFDRFQGTREKGSGTETMRALETTIRQTEMPICGAFCSHDNIGRVVGSFGYTEIDGMKRVLDRLGYERVGLDRENSLEQFAKVFY